jgi:hypothetical protein
MALPISLPSPAGLTRGSILSREDGLPGQARRRAEPRGARPSVRRVDRALQAAEALFSHRRIAEEQLRKRPCRWIMRSAEVSGFSGASATSHPDAVWLVTARYVQLGRKLGRDFGLPNHLDNRPPAACRASRRYVPSHRRTGEEPAHGENRGHAGKRQGTLHARPQGGLRRGPAIAAALFDRFAAETLLAVKGQPAERAATMFFRMAVALEVLAERKGWPERIAGLPDARQRRRATVEATAGF